MLSRRDKYEIIIATCLFFLLYGFGNTVFMNKPFDAKFVVVLTVMFMLWMSFSKILSNYVISYYFTEVK